MATAQANTADGSLLTVVIDSDPVAWGMRAERLNDGISFRDVLDDLLIFINAFLLLSGRNRLVVVAAHPNSSRVLYPLPESPPPPVAPDGTPSPSGSSGLAPTTISAATANSDKRPSLSEVAKLLSEGLKALGAGAIESGGRQDSADRPSKLSEAMSRALLLVNRFCPIGTVA